MLRNYLTAALRNMARNRLYAAINIAGLALGFAAVILIALFVRDEFSYDTWMPDQDRTFLVTELTQLPGRTPSESHSIPPEFAELLTLDYPSIQSIARVVSEGVSLRHGDIEANETIWWADPEIFDVLPFAAVTGGLKGALDAPDSLVLTERMARKYFGDANPIGATVEINRKTPVRVTAVLRDLPSNTHLTTEILVSSRAATSFFTNRKANPRAGWWEAGYTYLRLRPDASLDALTRELAEFLPRHMASSLKRLAQAELRLVPMASVHLQTENSSSAMKPTGDARVAYALAGIAVLIVAIAGMNFVNLMTARATRRAVEVGVRKATGAARHNLVGQFLGESVVYAALSAVVAVVAVHLLLPIYNAFLGREIVFDYWRDARLGGGIVGFVVFAGVLAGFYPALVLSSFRPAAVLKGAAMQSTGSGRLRKVLVLAQFAILIALTVGVGVIYRQTSFALNEGLRLDKDQILLVGTQCKTAFAERVPALPGVHAVACSERDGVNSGSNNAPFSRPGGEQVLIAHTSVDFGYFDLYGLRPLAGRFFSADFPSDTAPAGSNLPAGFLMRASASIVINETAMRRLGFPSPEAAIGQTISLTPASGNAGPPQEIIGVVPDFSFDSIHSLISPSFYYRNPQTFNWLSIKLTGRDLPETIQAIDALWKEAGDPRPITRLFVDQEVGKLYLDIRRQSQLFAGFAGVALFVAALGLFGLSAFTAEQRTKEIGIRKAMGATRRDILRLLLWQFTKPVLWANVIAWPVAYFVMKRWLEGFAYHIELAPWMFLAASALAVGIAVLTVISHALLVARAQPASALRYE